MSRFERIEALYHAARARIPEERSAFLESACEGDADLRREVESLLAQSAGGDVLSDLPGTAVAVVASLLPGTRIGIYRIERRLDGGGMGDVYVASDLKLGREVAVKVLPPSFVDDPDRRARFDREARILAALNHPNIAQIYGVEESGPQPAIVMELVRGRTLTEVIPASGLSLEACLPLARQIAEALDAAHAQGIVHRDLKPGNIKVTPEGVVKVLDFGLAKAQTADALAAAGHASTNTGVILGTSVYMSPEQARGVDVDKRTDIWAFGCVLFEMLTGRAAFGRATVAETLANVIQGAPDWAALPPSTPAPVRELLRRCLTKDPRRRLRDSGDAAVFLEGPWTERDDTPGRTIRGRHSTGWIAGAALGAIVTAAAAMAILWWRGGGAPAEAIPFTVAPPANTTLGGYAVSPDGHHLVFVALSQGVSSLWLQSIPAIPGRSADQLLGTERAFGPFWSADSRSVGFFVPGKLEAVALNGGAPFVICDAAAGRGGTWNSDNVIVFAPGTDGVLQKVVASAGAQPSGVTVKDAARGDTTHRQPMFLPDGRHFLFTAGGGRNPDQVQVGSLDTTDVVPLDVKPGARYAAGHLLYISGGTLMAHPFDVRSLRLFGKPVPVTTQRVISVSVSDTGVLAYVLGTTATASQYVWFDRSGRPLEGSFEPGLGSINLSPDERQGAAVSADRGRNDLFDRHIEVFDLAADMHTQFTSGPRDYFPVWSPHGDRIVFSRVAERYELLEKPSNFATGETPLPGQDSMAIVMATDWSPDGRFIATTAGSSSDVDVWMFPTGGDRKPFPFVQGPGAQTHARFSPDGRFIAYETDQSGRSEIWIKRFPDDGSGQRQISGNGGAQPAWARDTGELFFLAPDGYMMSVKGVAPGVPQRLFPVAVAGGSGFGTVYAVARDGLRFLVNTRPPDPSALTVVINWPALLQGRVTP